MIIAVDFDGTICEEKEFPGFGKFLPGAVETLKALATKGHILTLWTCRTGDLAQTALKHCQNAGIPFDSVNTGVFQGELHQYKKLYADIYIDNRNFENQGRKAVDWNVIASSLLGKGDASILWKGDFLRVISPRTAPYEAVQTGNSVIVFLFDVAKQAAYIRKEHCPPYEYGMGMKYWYTVISGGINKGETPLQAAIREVHEEVGIDLQKDILRYRQLYHGKFMKTVVDMVTVFLFKVANPVIEKPQGDGTVYEKESIAVAVPYKEIELLRPRDFLLESIWAMAKPWLGMP